MGHSIQNMLEREQQQLNTALTSYIKELTIPDRLKESVLYSIEAGGKRLRPLLMKLTCTGLGGDPEKVYPAAVALEMIHTYSLIHDDLPAMDDDTYRRGQLTNHKKYDEATAILAGDGLLTNSFHVITTSNLYTDQEKVNIVTKLSKASGLEGMVAGQYLDMEAENQTITISNLERIHHLKTGRLISFAVVIGGFLAGASLGTMEILKKYGDYLGIIFQIQDDILDIEGDQAIIGKRVGSDIDNEKNTYPSILGLDGAKRYKAKYVNEAVQCLQEVGLENTDLALISSYLSERNQ
ncbi:geranylgeranyl diphosphate synthase, type II [Gracilibacillus orientalis]|uniref:Farnesyl diphosphate synthase n=1 Tax=Gracilibacillus orientalis TaxID=334253 RepID=A0A1I4KWZ0_9BACI|nr:farnesyl diphosphate synthase [Gracilibacillus orientalis]SFL83113.1 geranylgeranyl diphosphate synthase, type II [Gracilibacillus orientalis]